MATKHQPSRAPGARTHKLIQVYVCEELWAAVKRNAAARGLTQSDLITRRMLRDDCEDGKPLRLTRDERKALRRRGVVGA